MGVLVFSIHIWYLAYHMLLKNNAMEILYADSMFVCLILGNTNSNSFIIKGKQTCLMSIEEI